MNGHGMIAGNRSEIGCRHPSRAPDRICRARSQRRDTAPIPAVKHLQEESHRCVRWRHDQFRRRYFSVDRDGSASWSDRYAASLIPDERNQAQITHSMVDILRERIFAIARGYPNGNDLDSLRKDLAFKMAWGWLRTAESIWIRNQRYNAWITPRTCPRLSGCRAA